MSQGQCLLAACGGDTVKLFDVSVETGDPCTFQYTPAHGSHVNCVKWNHTNLVVASAGEDRKVSLWMKNGQIVGVLPQPGIDPGDNIDESILAISFSNKGSRYLCSGGTGKVVRVWDLQRKRCIKWLKGHNDTITGVMYNNKDEHLASISVKGDLILHNLASGTQAAELKDPHRQVLRVLEYSRLSRHILVTAGDDGSVHLWDTTGRSPKVSWIKQHSAPTTGLAFSPSNDKMIVSVGLDKKLYIFDSTMRKPVHYGACEAPFSSLGFKDDGLILAAGTNSGRVFFYDVRGKPQPFTILRAYGSSEAVTSLGWQHSKPIPVNEANCTMEVALLGVTGEDSVLMPDPLPASFTNKHGRAASTSIPVRTAGSLPGSTSESPLVSETSMTSSRSGEETPIPAANHLWTKGHISRLQTPRNSFMVKDDMEVFSPLVDVQPITPSVSSFWASSDDLKKELGAERKLAWGPTPPGEVRRFPSIEELKNETRSIADRLSPLQEDLQVRSCPSSPVASTPPPGISPKGGRSPSITPPEAWGGDGHTDKVILRQQGTHSMSRFALPTTPPASIIVSSRVASTSSSDVPGTLATDMVNLASVHSTYQPTQRSVLDFPVPDQPSFIVPGSEPLPMTSSSSGAGSLGGRQSPAVLNLEASSDSSFVVPTGKSMLYAERIVQAGFLRSISSSTGDGIVSSGGSPRQNRALTERNNDHSIVDGVLERKRDSENGHNLRSDAATVTGATSAAPNGHMQPISQRSSSQEHQGPPSFALQLVQRTLEESLGAVQMAIHEDVQNLHLELLRQFHVQQTETAAMMDAVLAKQAELMEEIQNLRRENQQLRQFF